MNCEECQSLLDPLVDGELAPGEEQTLRRHLQGCSACGEELAALEALRNSLGQIAPFKVTGGLSQAVRDRLDISGGPHEPVKPRQRTRLRRWMLPIGTHGAAAVFGALLLFGANHLLPPPSLPAQAVVSAHVRALMAGQLTQVTTGDPHRVGPWFSGKLDYAPPVRDLRPAGFPLIGGRVDYLHDRKIAVLVYMRRKHWINVFISPLSASRAEAAATGRHSRNGYNLVRLRQGDFELLAVSDLNAAELESFTKLLAAAI